MERARGVLWVARDADIPGAGREWTMVSGGSGVPAKPAPRMRSVLAGRGRGLEAKLAAAGSKPPEIKESERLIT